MATITCEIKTGRVTVNCWKRVRRSVCVEEVFPLVNEESKFVGDNMPNLLALSD